MMRIAALLLACLTACAPERAVPSIEGATCAVALVDRMTVLGSQLPGDDAGMPVALCGGKPARPGSMKPVKETNVAAEIAALAAFANERRDGFTTAGLATPPSGTLSVRFYDDGVLVDGFDVGGGSDSGTYFIARTIGPERLYRRLPLEDLAILAGLLGHTPATVFQR